MIEYFLALMVALTTPCVEEDSANCFWDATRHGNGEGTSFIDINGEVHYYYLALEDQN